MILETMARESFLDTSTEKKPVLVSTGIDKLDRLLEGGIPGGFTVVLLGSPGSSIEILIKQVAASSGNVTYITTEETKQEILDTMSRFKWQANNIDFVDISERYYSNVLKGEQKRVSIYEQRSKMKLKELIELGSTAMPSTVTSDEDYLAVVSNRTKNAVQNSTIIISSLDFFLSQYAQEDVLKTVYAAKVNNLKNKGALLIVMTKGVHGELLERKMEGIADAVLELDVIQKGSSFERYLSVKKMRNYAKKIGIARYVIDDSGFVLEMIERIM
ncbi:MAG TPA: RAD55 family ATPase [Candidatus Thermoplasmatota archaeon]|nr:RAD55 family ATPase [Candidatus Thermoplasmatota archaeon]